MDAQRSLRVCILFVLLLLSVHCQEDMDGENVELPHDMEEYPEDAPDEAHDQDDHHDDDQHGGEHMDEGEHMEQESSPSDGDETPSQVFDEMQPEEIHMSVAQMDGLHGKIDKNDDGKISLPEVLAFSIVTRLSIAKEDVQGSMELMDTDKNGKISSQEFLNYQTPPPNPPRTGEDNSEEEIAAEAEAEKKHQQEVYDYQMAVFKIADKDADGNLDETEVPAAVFPDTDADAILFAATNALKQNDKDGSGELSPQEMWQLDPNTPGNEGASEAQDDDFKSLDKDRSGGLNVEELKDWESGAHHVKVAMEHLFNVADSDNDHHITKQEFRDGQAGISGHDASSHLSEWAAHHEL